MNETGPQFVLPEITPDFERRRREYFTNLGYQAFDAIKAHRDAGLWGKEAGNFDWKNVTEHCLVSAARGKTLAELMGLSDETQKMLLTAELLHDVYKRREIEKAQTQDFSAASFEESMVEQRVFLEDRAISDQVIWLTSAVGNFEEVEKILQKQDQTESELAFLITQYVDSYTVGSDWVEPAHINEGGRTINQLDLRASYNENNPQNKNRKEEIVFRETGEKHFEAQRRQGHAMEQLFSKLILEKTGQRIEPTMIPESIEIIIIKKIENS